MTININSQRKCEEIIRDINIKHIEIREMIDIVSISENKKLSQEQYKRLSEIRKELEDIVSKPLLTKNEMKYIAKFLNEGNDYPLSGNKENFLRKLKYHIC